MIDLNKLNSQFDINNLDLTQITRILAENQKIISIALMIGSLLMVGTIFNDYHVKDGAVRVQMSREKMKMEAIKSRDKAVQDFNVFKSTIPKEVNVFELITLITNYAKLNNCNVASYVPGQSKDAGMYEIINVRFDLVSDNFKDLMLFLRKIEKSNLPLRVDSWIGHEGEDGRIAFTTEISAVQIHP